ncbi:MAG: zinc ribbon domain-containing protein [Candidatus Bathyarchaeia archaeon]
MPIDDFLLKDETILASAKAKQSGTLYATNKRVIRHNRSILAGEKFHSLTYTHIIGSSYERQSFIKVTIWGILVSFLGAILYVVASYLGGGFETSALLFVVGLILIVIGLAYRPAYYRINAVGSPPELWMTADDSADAKTFARLIQDQISTRETPPPSAPIAREREVITREVVMIRCEYCGALMTESSTFCPNCGAKRT